jgi:hypothetical protein
MNSKTVLQKIMTLLSADKEVNFTYARLKDGTIVESPTFDLGETLDVVSEDGTKSPAPNGWHELALKDTEGNETYIKVFAEDGKIKERENVELAAAETVKTKPFPAAGNTNKENVMPTQPGSVTSGLEVNDIEGKGKVEASEEQTDEVSKDLPETDGEPEGEVEVEEETEMGAKIEKLQYRIAELEKKIQQWEDANFPPVDSEVTDEEAGIKMAKEEDEEEELPKLDGAPIESTKMSAIENNSKNYGKKVVDSQSTFLSKLYK